MQQHALKAASASAAHTHTPTPASSCRVQLCSLCTATKQPPLRTVRSNPNLNVQTQERPKTEYPMTHGLSSVAIVVMGPPRAHAGRTTGAKAAAAAAAAGLAAASAEIELNSVKRDFSTYTLSVQLTIE